MKVRINKMATVNIGRNEKCFCGSERKFKYCHMRKIKEAGNAVKKNCDRKPRTNVNDIIHRRNKMVG